MFKKKNVKAEENLKKYTYNFIHKQSMQILVCF